MTRIFVFWLCVTLSIFQSICEINFVRITENLYLYYLYTYFKKNTIIMYFHILYNYENKLVLLNNATYNSYTYRRGFMLEIENHPSVANMINRIPKKDNLLNIIRKRPIIMFRLISLNLGSKYPNISWIRTYSHPISKFSFSA